MEEEGGAGGEEDVKEAVPNHREALTAGASNIICSPVVKQKSALLPVFITASLWWFVRHLMLFSGSAQPTSGSRDPNGRNAEYGNQQRNSTFAKRQSGKISGPGKARGAK